MKAMERFVEAVQEMDETILVPSRLMDLEAGASGDTAGLASSTDLYGLYTMVNCVKNELLWGVNSSNVNDNYCDDDICCGFSDNVVISPQTATITSAQSVTLSDTDSDTSSTSGNEIPATNKKASTYTRNVEASFRRHLYGLQRSLAQMTAAASYLTKRYQSDIGASV
ncbi:hypothetical protein O3M35_009075 [Rhynocoris fuscipes]|uniref:Uncharacterized protein n=1 Tax=Rhynocoris fuscipes TaxID=488301 RepID=A0AAW1D1N8_9HEMI